jgi:hypothetical protein
MGTETVFRVILPCLACAGNSFDTYRWFRYGQEERLTYSTTGDKGNKQ